MLSSILLHNKSTLNTMERVEMSICIFKLTLCVILS